MRPPPAQTLVLTALLGLGTLPGGAGWGAAQPSPAQPSPAQTAPAPPPLAQPAGARLEALPGDFLTLALRLADQPPGTYRVTASLPRDWALLTAEVELAAGGAALLALHLPDDALAGPHDLTLTLTGPGEAGGRGPTSVPVTVVVAAQPDFVLTLPDPAQVRPGERRTFAARVTNLGNARDTLRLSVEGSASVTPERLTLGPGESAEVRLDYTQSALGNADTLTLHAQSSVDPALRREGLLVLSVGTPPARGGGPQLTWSATLAPEVSREGGAREAPLPRDPVTGVPTLPGLPAAPAGGADPAGDTGGLNWGGHFGFGVGGQLSDYASGGVGYAARRLDDGSWRDDGLAQLDWGELSVTARSRSGLSQLDLGAEYRRGDYLYGVHVARGVGEGGVTYGVGGRVSHRSGLYLSATHTFGEPGGDAFGVGWTRTLGAFTPTLEASALRLGARWGYGVLGRLDYENALLLLRQEYRYDSLAQQQQLSVQVSSRQLEPFGVSAGVNVSTLGGVWRYDLSGQATYRPDDHFRAAAQVGYGSDGFRARLSALKQWPLGAGDLYLGAQAASEGGQLSGAAQLTAALPQPSGELLLSGLVGYAGGVYAGAGAGYLRGPFSVAGSVQYGASGLRGSLGAAYRPERGLYLSADYRLDRGDLGLGQSVRGSLGYGRGGWSAGALLGYRRAPGQEGQVSYGASATGQLLPTLQVQASAERSGERTRFSVGGRFTPSGAVRTPDAVVALFGGRNAGTLRLRAFEDLNRNGARDAGEPGVASRFLIGGQPLSTDAAGEASLLLKPGRYEVGLDGDVLAQFLIPTLPAVEVKWRETARVEVPVRQVGSVQGRLTDEGGRPVVGAEVRLAGAGGEHSAVSDGAGYYRLSGLDFGTFTLTLQADPALYRVPGAAPLTLTSGQALLTHDAVLASNAELRGVETGGLSLRVILPQEALPPGTTLPIRVEVAPAAGSGAASPDASAAESVVVEGLPTPAALRNTGGNVWEGTLTLPAGQQTPLEVQVVARRGSGSVAEERALLLVDPALPAASLQAAPYNALPGQVLTLRAVVYGAVARVQVRDAGGRVTDLSAGPGRSYAAELAAPASPGSHTLTLLVDGEPRAEATYRVLGRP